MRILLLYIILIFLFTLEIHAQVQDGSRFSLYTTEDGLSHNYVTDIRQDATGYIWISTGAGLNRFNGREFIQYHSSNDSNSLPAEELWGATWLDQQRLAVFTSGLHIVHTATGKSENIFIPYKDKKYQFKFNMVSAAKGDKEGNTYVLTRSGFYQFDKNNTLVFRYDYFRDQDVPVSHFYFGTALFALNEKKLLIVSIAGLYVYDKEQRKLEKMRPQDEQLLAEFLDYSNERRYMFYQPAAGEFIIVKSYNDSLVYVNLHTRQKVVSRSPVNPQSKEIGWRSKLIRASDSLYYLTGHLSGYFELHLNREKGSIKMLAEKHFPGYLCNSLLSDREGHLWVATGRGLFREDKKGSNVQTLSLPKDIVQNFPNARVFDVHVTGGRIYVGTNEAGLFIYDHEKLSFIKQVVSTKDKRLNYVRSISAFDGNRLLLGTHGPLAAFNMRTTALEVLHPPQWNMEGDWTNYVYEDRKGGAWISAYHIYHFEKSTGRYTIIPGHSQLLDVPFVLSEDRQGNIWMGGHGLARYNTGLGKYDVYIDSFPFIKMPDKQVAALVVDDENTVWFNANNNGLIAYHPKSGRYHHFTKKNGLPDDNISSLIMVGKRLWIACYSGLACMDINTHRIMSFGKPDGFPDMPIVKGTKLYYDSTAHQLYVPFELAIARFNPDSILKKKIPPNLFVESIVVNGKKNHFLPGDAIEVSWKDEELQVGIGTINFQDGEAQRFAYRIYKDESSPWVQLGHHAVFSISSLPPGKHTLQVKTFSLNNKWPEQLKQFQIAVHPPFWLQGWFFIMAGLLFLLIIYLLIKWRTNVVRRKEMEKTQIESIKADHYKNQFELEQISSYFSSSVAGKKSVDDVLWDVAQNLIGRMNYEDCVIYLWNPEKTRMVQKAAWGPKGKPEVIKADGFEVVPGQGIVGYVVETGQPVLVNDTTKDLRYRVDDEYRLSEVAVPILHNNEILGVIDSENSRANYFSERDIKILTTIATLIGNKLKQIESEHSLEAKQLELAGINEQLAEARLSALQAQMNPHFVFNALNSIKRMILDGDNETASRYLSKFALMIRMTLEHSKEVFVTLDENIEYLKAYLDMEKLRFDDSFSYAIETDDQVDTTETVLPSMMIQPLVENAIWHGLMHAKNEKKILIRFSQEQNKVICTIEDNGIGVLQSEQLRKQQRPLHRSVGLENLQKRIKIMNEKYHTGCSLRIMDLNGNGHGSGTRVVLTFNLINT